MMKLLLGLTVQIAMLMASCHSAPPTYPKQLMDGCYYSDGKAVFKIIDTKGQVLVPGEVSAFSVE